MRKNPIPLLVAAALAAIAALLPTGDDDRLQPAAPNLAQDPIGSRPPRATADLDNVTCDTDDAGAVARGGLTNVGKHTSSFELVVDFYDRSGTHYVSATATVENLPVGSHTTWDAHPGTPLALLGTCEVSDITTHPPA